MVGKKVTFKSENVQGDCSGVLFGETSQSKKGLIVMHEWWGMNRSIQTEGELISRLGSLVVLVPDFYRGKVAINNETAGHLMDNLDWPGAVKDIQAAARYLKDLGCLKVGVTGFCMGGGLSFAAAALVPEISAAAPFYGLPPKDFVDISTIKVPVQCHFAEKDDSVDYSTPADYEPAREKMEKGGVPLIFYTYDAGHAFTNPDLPQYDAEICALSLKRMTGFMNEKLSE